MPQNNDRYINKFSNNLFWDIDTDSLDFKRNKRFIIQRALEYGTLDDWHTIKTLYSIDTIGEEMIKVRSLHKTTLSFLSSITGIKKENFRCYTTKQSIPQHWNF